MKKSKYFHYSQIKENVYAVFNSLILEVVYLKKMTLTICLIMNITN